MKTIEIDFNQVNAKKTLKRENIQIEIDFTQIPNTQTPHEQIDTHQNSENNTQKQTTKHHCQAKP